MKKHNDRAQDRDETQGNDIQYSPKSVILQHDRIFQHNIMRINYTTYDTRRAQDAINASTPLHNIIVLDDSYDSDQPGSYPFRYARVLGVYHTNTIYSGPGMIDYQPHRITFLWVRWYCVVKSMPTGWRTYKLDLIEFPPLAEDTSFGFVDPAQVIRSCHIILAFARGKFHLDSKGLLPCARDHCDWQAYYVNRCVDQHIEL